jgi:hypothetical protein
MILEHIRLRCIQQLEHLGCTSNLSRGSSFEFPKQSRRQELGSECPMGKHLQKCFELVAKLSKDKYNLWAKYGPTGETGFTYQ